MEQLINVIILPTKDKSTVYKLDDSTLHIGDFAKCKEGDARRVNQYTYITVSQDVEPIKKGDWFISGNDGELKRFNRGSVFSESRKIIATTDPKLTDGEWDLGIPKRIPQLQQSFLEEYVANPDEEYVVEYETETFTVDNSSDFDVPHSIAEYTQNTYTRVVGLKINQDNTVNIISAEERIYSRKEIENKFNEFISNQQDIDSEFVQIFNDNFWKLLD